MDTVSLVALEKREVMRCGMADVLGLFEDSYSSAGVAGFCFVRRVFCVLWVKTVRGWQGLGGSAQTLLILREKCCRWMQGCWEYGAAS